MAKDEIAKLKPKQKLFCELYVTSANFNATKAALDAGYAPKSAYQLAHLNMKIPAIRAYIDELISERSLGKNEVLARLADIATASVENYFDDNGHFDYEKAKASGNLGLVKRLKTKVTERRIGDSPAIEIDRTYEVEMYSAHEALRDLGKYHKLFTDRIEHADEKGGPLFPKDISVSIDMIYGSDDEGPAHGSEQPGSDS